jgi:hypothetical protein
MVAMRNVLIHGHFDIDVDLVWSVAQNDLSKLDADLARPRSGCGRLVCAGEGGFGAVEEVAPGAPGGLGDAEGGGEGGAVGAEGGADDGGAASGLVPGRSSGKASASRRATVSPARPDSCSRPAKACRRRSPTA